MMAGRRGVGNVTKGKKCIGLLVRGTEDVIKSLSNARNQGFHFICVGPILKASHVQADLEGRNELDGTEPFAWFDLTLSCYEWKASVVGIMTDVKEELEGTDDLVAQRARNLLHREIEFTHHVSLPALLIELVRGKSYVNLAQIVHSFAYREFGSQRFWVKVPLVYQVETGAGDSAQIESSWMLWHKFRTLCNYEPYVYPSVELTLDLPDEQEIQRWLGEPVKCVIIPKSCFSQSKEFPVLSPRHQDVLKQFMELGAHIIIDPGNDNSDLTAFQEYIDNLQTSSEVNPALVDGYSGVACTSGFEDFLQSPLQPLQDNLEGSTYEVFEKDPVKYKLYTAAVHDALVDLVPEEEMETRIITLMVVGAGRGPLVRSSIEASNQASRKIKVYAIEKNANAANTLFHLNKLEWQSQVTVINADIREWNAEEKADIIISELLGSFGDNELSPECLDSAQTFLKPGGVMIPQSYRSYISPVMSSKLFNQVRNERKEAKNVFSRFETPYVVHMKNRYIIAQPQLVFSFVHPKPDVKETNERYKVLNFRAKEDCVLHGFGGYFECTLYKQILISILPSSFSEGMFSWFPMFFPIQDPVDIRKGCEIKAHFWRCVRKTAVWYEWTISSPVPIHIHNPNGRSYTIGL